MYAFEINYRVCYGDTDQMGVVYYGNYPRLYELGRTEMLRKLGLSYKEIEAMGITLPVSSMNVQYHRPAYYDDLLTIRTVIKEVPRSRIQFFYEIINEQGQVINTGETVLAFINNSSNRPTRAPKEVLQVLAPHFSSN